MSTDQLTIIGGAGSTKANLDEISSFARGCHTAGNLTSEAIASLGSAVQALSATDVAASGLGQLYTGSFESLLGESQAALPFVRDELHAIGDGAERARRIYEGAEQYGAGVLAPLWRAKIALVLEQLTENLRRLNAPLGAVLRTIDNPGDILTITKVADPEAPGPVDSVRDAVGRVGLRHPDSSETADGSYRIQIDRIEHPDGSIAWQVFLPGMQAFGDNSHPIDIPHVVGAADGGPSDATRAIDEAMHQAGIKPGEPVMLAGHSAGGMAAAAFVNTAAAKKYTISSVLTAGSPTRRMKAPPSDTQMLNLEHWDDFVTYLDGGPTPPAPNRTIIRGQSLRSPRIDPPDDSQSIGELIGDPHRTARYEELGALVDRYGQDPSLDTFKAAMARSTPKVGSSVSTQEFVVALEPKPGEQPTIGEKLRQGVPPRLD